MMSVMDKGLVLMKLVWEQQGLQRIVITIMINRLQEGLALDMSGQLLTITAMETDIVQITMNASEEQDEMIKY